MSLTRESREAEGADLLSKTPDKSDAMSTFPTTEQTDDDQHHQSNTTGAAASNASNVTMPPRPEQAEDRIDLKIAWNESSSYHDHNILCSGPRQESPKTTDEGTEPISETAPKENPASPLVEKTASVEDPVCSSSPPFLNSEAPKQVAAKGNSSSLKPDWKSSPPVLTRSSEINDDQFGQEDECIEGSLRRIEAPIATASGEKSYFSKLHLHPAKSKRADDDGIEMTAPAPMATAPGENPYLSTRPLPKTQSERSDDMAAAPGENPYLSTRPLPTTQSERSDDDDGIEAPGENPYLSARPLPTTQSERTDDMAAVPSENPDLLTRPLPTTQSGSTSGDGTQAVQRTAPGENLSLSTLSLTSTEAAWQSSQTAWQSIKRGEQTTKKAQTSALSLASSEAASSSEVARQSTKQGEQTAEIAQTSNLALTSSEAAWQSSKIAWQSMEGKERTAEIVRTQKQIATSSTKASRHDFSATLIGQPGPKVREKTDENQTLSGSSPLIVVPGPRDDSSQHIPLATAKDGKSFRYFSHVDIPVNQPIVRAQYPTVIPPPHRNCAIPATGRKAGVFSHDKIPQKCPVERVRPQTLRLICNRLDAATKNDSSRPAKSQREPPISPQQSQPPNPSQDSKIQRIPTKNPGQQYYSQLIYGGWKVLNARDAAIEIQREDRAWRARKRTAEGKCKEAAESEREDESNRGGSGSQSPGIQPSFTRPPTSDGITSINPPGKRRRHTDYQGLISCRPSDKVWKSWENKHLLRSYATGSSFAQISASRKFSNGLVIRSEKECHDHYKALHEWQPFQDEELLRVGESEAKENFAQICSANFSRGLVKRSAEQCKERFEFLRKNEKKD